PAVPAVSLRRVVREVFARPEYDWIERLHFVSWLQTQWHHLIQWLDRTSAQHPLSFNLVLALSSLALLFLLVHIGYVVLRIVRPAARPGTDATPKRWRTGSWRYCSSWTAAKRCAFTSPRHRPSTSGRSISTIADGRRSRRSSPPCTAISSAPSRATRPSTPHLVPPRRSWPEVRMSYRLEIGLAALLAVSIGLALWAGSRNERTPDFDLRASTFLNGPYGSKGLHDVLLQLGRRSERRRTSLDDLATERAHRPAILVLNAPTIPLDDDEVGQVVRFLQIGRAHV